MFTDLIQKKAKFGGGFPWGKLALYMAALFWLTAFITGSTKTYKLFPGMDSLFSLILWGLTVALAMIGLFQKSINGRVFSAVALGVTVGPLLWVLMKAS